jgi:hypothetical protein
MVDRRRKVRRWMSDSQWRYLGVGTLSGMKEARINGEGSCKLQRDERRFWWLVMQDEVGLRSAWNWKWKSGLFVRRERRSKGGLTNYCPVSSCPISLRVAGVARLCTAHSSVLGSSVLIASSFANLVVRKFQVNRRKWSKIGPLLVEVMWYFPTAQAFTSPQTP